MGKREEYTGGDQEYWSQSSWKVSGPTLLYAGSTDREGKEHWLRELIVSRLGNNNFSPDGSVFSELSSYMS